MGVQQADRVGSYDLDHAMDRRGRFDRDTRYRRRLFEKTGLAKTADGSDDNLINLEGVERGTYSFMDVDTTPEPLEDVLPISPAPADEENPPGSNDED